MPDQKMTLNDGEGNTWTSDAKDNDGVAITTIRMNEKVVAVITYNYENGEETEITY